MFSKSSPTKRKRIRKGVKERTAGLGCIWPSGIEAHYGISPPTRWRWEKDRKLPPRDVFVGGVAVGWKPSTIDIAERGPAAVQTA